MAGTSKALVQCYNGSSSANIDKVVYQNTTANKSDLTKYINDMQVLQDGRRNRFSIVFKYLKLKLKLKKTLSKIWFNKKCLYLGIVPMLE